ncbi:MAG: FtsH protease activity modulator HflK [Spirochaetales bacterium]|nr:FtsH protease activity modulator HflK [Spirochaetales bacterium]
MAEKNVTPSRFNLPIKAGLLVLIIIGIVILAGVFTSVYTVDETELAVVLRFGKFHTTAGAGLHTRLPFGIDKVEKVPIKVQTMEFGYRTTRADKVTEYARGDFSNETEMLTGDLNIVNVEWSIQYKISDPRAWLFNVEYKEETIRDISQSVINRLVGDRAILRVIGAERDKIGSTAVDEMNNILQGYDMGLTITQIQLQNTRPPKGDVQAAFDDVNVATQDMNTLINQGKEEYNKIIPKAKGEASKILLDAEAYSAGRINGALGDVQKYLAILDQWKKSPAVTEKRLMIEMFEEAFLNSAGTTLIDKNLNNNSLILKNLQQGGKQ